MVDGEDLIDIPFFVNTDRGEQYRLSISEFRDKQYLSIRKWYLDYEGQWTATREGVSMPYELELVSHLFAAFCGIMSKAEVLDQIGKYLLEKGDNERLPKETE